jgi:hypothetical protein
MAPEKAAELTARCVNIDTDGSRWWAVVYREGSEYVGYGETVLAAVIAAHEKAKNI